jgi:S-methylmethionine-dependent homocysteine/selenocysteine methylase
LYIISILNYENIRRWLWARTCSSWCSFRQPEWSALALTEAPEIVKEVHLDFIRAGAEVITTNNYAVVPHIGEERFENEVKQLVQIAVDQAKYAVIESDKNVLIAGCLPPLFGSYRADLFKKMKQKN